MNVKPTNLASYTDTFDYPTLLKGFFIWNTKEPLSRKNFWLALGCNFLLWLGLSIIILVSGLNVGFVSISIEPAFGIGAALVSLFFLMFFIYLAALRLRDLNADGGRLAFLFKPKTFYVFMLLYILIFAGFLYLCTQMPIEDIKFLIYAFFNSYLFCLAVVGLILFSFILSFYLFVFLFDNNASLLGKKPLNPLFDIFSTCFFVLALALIVYFSQLDFEYSFDNSMPVKKILYTLFIFCLVVVFIVVFFYLPNFITRLFASIVLGLYCISFVMQATKDLDTFFEISLLNTIPIFILGLFFWALNYKNAAILMFIFLFYRYFRIEDDKIGLSLDMGFALGILFAVFAGLSFWKKFNDFDKNKAYVPSFALGFIGLVMLSFLSEHYFFSSSSSLQYGFFEELKAVVMNYAYEAFCIYVFYYFAHKNLANKALKLSILGLIISNLFFTMFIVSVKAKIVFDIPLWSVTDEIFMSLTLSFYFWVVSALFTLLLTLALKKEHKLFALAFGVYIFRSILEAFLFLSQANAGKLNFTLVTLSHIIYFIFIIIASFALYKQYKKGKICTQN